MATAPITESDVHARFPETATIDTNLMAEILAEVHEEVGDHWPENLRARAQLYLTAHLIAAEGGLNRTLISGDVGPMTKRKEGDVEVTYAEPFAFTGGSGSDYSGSPYGRRYAELRRAAFSGTFRVA